MKMFGRRGSKGEHDEVLLDPTTVDIVAFAQDGATTLLVITHAFAWTGSDAQVMSLQEKIHTYVGYALDGQMVADNPSAAGMAWRIEIVAKEPLDTRTSRVIADVGEAVRRYGGDLTFRTVS